MQSFEDRKKVKSDSNEKKKKARWEQITANMQNGNKNVCTKCGQQKQV